MNNNTLKLNKNHEIGCTIDLNRKTRKYSFFNKTKTKKKSKQVRMKWYNKEIPLTSYYICFLSYIKVTDNTIEDTDNSNHDNTIFRGVL